MMLNTIKKLMLVLTILISTNAYARVHEFEEIFTGTLVKAESTGPDSFMAQSTLLNGDVALTLYYEVNNFSPVFYVGAFTRTDSQGALSGNFNVYYSQFESDLLISGLFDQDSRSLTLPNTGAYQYGWAFGEFNGTITEQGYATLKISWQIGTPDVFVPVPEPQTGLMLGSGLLILGIMRFKLK